MDAFTYDIEVRGLGFTTSWSPEEPSAYLRLERSAARFDQQTDQGALSIATYGLARAVERVGLAIDSVLVPAYIDDTGVDEHKRVYEESYLLTEFFRKGSISIHLAREHVVRDPALLSRIDDLLVELDHAYVLGARTHKSIRELIDEQASIHTFDASNVR